MATFTLARPDVFPDGTDVGAYANETPNRDGSPSGAAVDTQTMTSGTLTFDGLTEGETYLAAAEISSGVWRTIGFTVDTPSTALASDANVEITGDWELSGVTTLSGDLVTSGDLNGVTLPVEVTGARDAPEEALANALTALASLGLITDSTTETTA